MLCVRELQVYGPFCEIMSQTNIRVPVKSLEYSLKEFRLLISGDLDWEEDANSDAG